MNTKAGLSKDGSAFFLYLCRRFERGAFMAEIRPVEPDADNAAVGRQTLLFPNPSFSMFNY